MTNKELRKLSRAELIELLIDHRQQYDQQQKELEKTREWLRDKEINLQKAGNIAQASMQLSGVFKAAQDAAEQYVSNIQRMTRQRAEQMIAETERKCRERESQAGNPAVMIDRFLTPIYKDYPGLQERVRQMLTQGRR